MGWYRAAVSRVPRDRAAPAEHLAMTLRFLGRVRKRFFTRKKVSRESQCLSLSASNGNYQRVCLLQDRPDGILS